LVLVHACRARFLDRPETAADLAGAEDLMRLARQELAALPIALRVDAILPHPGATLPGGAAAAQEWPMESLILDGNPAEPILARRGAARLRMATRTRHEVCMHWDSPPRRCIWMARQRGTWWGVFAVCGLTRG
jgi:hypothetical protein